MSQSFETIQTHLYDHEGQNPGGLPRTGALIERLKGFPELDLTKTQLFFHRHWFDKGGNSGAYLGVRVEPNLSNGKRVVLKEASLKEAQVTAGLQHESIIKCLGYKYHDGKGYMVMEYPGNEFTSLRDVLSTRRLSLLEADTFLNHASDAVEFCEKQGVLHRDLKPGNFLVDHEFNVKMLDFGASNLAYTPKVEGEFEGTLAYMPPEIETGLDFTPASDTWTLAVMLYEQLTGKLPLVHAEVVRESLKNLYDQCQDTRYVLPEHFFTELKSAVTGLPKKQYRALELFFMRALQEKPSVRYQTPKKLYEAFYGAITRGFIQQDIEESQKKPRYARVVDQGVRPPLQQETRPVTMDTTPLARRPEAIEHPPTVQPILSSSVEIFSSSQQINNTPEGEIIGPFAGDNLNEFLPDDEIQNIKRKRDSLMDRLINRIKNL